MKIILDTSAAVETVLNGATAAHYNKILGDAEWVLAPMLFVCEAANVLWKYHRLEKMPLDECERAIEDCLAIPDSLADPRDSYGEAFAMACLTKHSVYDMMYAVLARRHNAYLATTDARLRDTCRKHSIRTI